MDRLDDLPPIPPPAPARPPRPPRPTYRPTGRQFARALGAVALVALTAGMHDHLAARWGLSPALVELGVAASAVAGAYVVHRTLIGVAVRFVPTVIICCCGGIVLATLAYGVGDIAASMIAP